jgi:hypothetical protein
MTREQLEKERNKINQNMSVVPIQILEENLENFVANNIFNLNQITYSTLFGLSQEKLLELMT